MKFTFSIDVTVDDGDNDDLDAAYRELCQKMGATGLAWSSTGEVSNDVYFFPAEVVDACIKRELERQKASLAAGDEPFSVFMHGDDCPKKHDGDAVCTCTTLER